MFDVSIAKLMFDVSIAKLVNKCGKLILGVNEIGHAIHDYFGDRD